MFTESLYIQRIHIVADSCCEFVDNIDNENPLSPLRVPKNKWFKREVTARALYLLNLIAQGSTMTLDSGLGLLIMPISMISGGTVANRLTIESLTQLEKIFSKALENAYRIVNPRLTVANIPSVADVVDQYWRNDNQFDNRNWNICVRLFAPFYLSGMIIARICDFVIGVFSILGSIFVLGTSSEMNKRAFSAFAFSGIVLDMYRTWMMVFNPSVCTSLIQK